MKTATFIPTAGYLICPNCHLTVRDRKGKEHLVHDDMASRWEANQRLPWQCNSCGKEFKLPANPFRRKESHQ